MADLDELITQGAVERSCSGTPPRVKVDKRAGQRRIALLVDSEEGSEFDGHRRWLVRWRHEAARFALPALHRACPTERLTFPS